MNPALTEFTWLPPHEVVRHQRAKHVKFSYSPVKGLRITLPMRMSMKHLPDIVKAHRAWIVLQVEKNPPSAFVRPSRIHLPLLESTWSVHYEAKQDRARLREKRSGELILNVAETSSEEVIYLLKKWVRRKALQHLPPLFQSVSEAIQLPYRRLSIRSQETMWGSCSGDHSIRLNDRLVFFPWPLARHIMIHELCHTQEMNHSAAFWSLVKKNDEHYRLHRQQCRHYQQQLPAWIQ